MPMRRLLLPILLMAATLLPAACGTHRGTAVTPTAETLVFDRHQVWQLVTLRGKAVPTSGPVTLVLNAEAGALNGRAWCNRYFADFTLRAATPSAEGTRYDLKVSYLGTDGLQCPEADMDAEGRYFALLAKVDGCLLTSYSLTLYRGGKEVMYFELQ